MKTLSGERLIAMIDSPGRINQTHADEGTGAIATSFAYTWHSGTFEIEQQTVTPPAVPSGQNGSGASAARKERFDDCDRLAWSMDELGRVSCRQYSKTRLVSSRVYHDIPASGAGVSGVNYEQTCYGYETFGTGKMGRQNRTLAPDGTITRLVLDARIANRGQLLRKPGETRRWRGAEMWVFRP